MKIHYSKQEEILALQKEGHTFHCAMRILTGDGECECNKQDFIPGNISRKMYGDRCPVCLYFAGHKDWCRNKRKAGFITPCKVHRFIFNGKKGICEDCGKVILRK